MFLQPGECFSEIMELLDSENWEDFFLAPVVVLMLGKSDCSACKMWTSTLREWTVPEGVQLGKILLDTPGLGRFKITHPWVAEVDILPYNAIFIKGKMKENWAGGGINRLESRLNRFI